MNNVEEHRNKTKRKGLVNSRRHKKMMSNNVSTTVTIFVKSRAKEEGESNQLEVGSGCKRISVEEEEESFPWVLLYFFH